MNLFIVYEYFSRVDNIMKRGNTVMASSKMPTEIHEIRKMEKEIANIYGHRNPHEIVIIDYKPM